MDREKVIKELTCCIYSEEECECPEDCPYVDDEMCQAKVMRDALALLKEQEKKKFFVDSDGKITPLPDVVRCKDCVHRGKAEKCVLAAITVDKDFLFMLDNHGEWYCADGKREAEEEKTERNEENVR